MSPDLYAGDSTAWALDLMVGAGGAAFVAATIRELFRVFGGLRGRRGGR